MPPLEPDFKTQLFEQFARVCKALGSAHRFELLFLMTNGEHSVEALTVETGMSIANTSQHLQQLKRSGLVSSRRAGNTIFYRLADPSILLLLQAARQTAESRLAEVDRLLDQLATARRDIPQVSFSAMQTALTAGEAVLLDVRPESEYRAGHMPGAVSIPLPQLERRWEEVAPNSAVIVTCRDTYSLMADEAVRLLAQHGVQAARLSDGFLEWKAAGGEIVSTPY